MPAARPLPDDYPRLTPYPCVEGAAEATVCVYVEDVPPEELARRAADSMGG